MSWLSSSTELVSGGWLSSAYAGHGIRGENIPSAGVSGASPVLNDSPIIGEEYRWVLVSPPSAGTLVMYEDLSFDFYGAPDGNYSFTYRLFETGVDVGVGTVYLQVGYPTVAVLASTGNATFSGSATSSGSVAQCSILASTANAVFAGSASMAGSASIAATTGDAVASLSASVSPRAAVLATTSDAVFAGNAAMGASAAVIATTGGVSVDISGHSVFPSAAVSALTESVLAALDASVSPVAAIGAVTADVVPDMLVIVLPPPECSISATTVASADLYAHGKDPDPVVPGTFLFSNFAEAVAELRADRLVAAAQAVPSVGPMSDSYLFAKLIAAEADAQRRLRIKFGPTTVFAGDPTAAEVSALAGAPFIVEPAYDYDPEEMFGGDQWGYLVTRESPIISVQSIEFAFPVGGSFRVPASWLRVDRAYGHIRIVPTGAGLVAPSSAWLMSMSRYVPHMIWVRYVAGLANAALEYPDLIDLVKRMAVLRLIDDAFPPASGSLSVDGLSQSMSVDVQKYQDRVDNMLAALESSLHGVRCMVV